MEAMVWHFVSGTHKVMTILMLVMLGLGMLELTECFPYIIMESSLQSYRYVISTVLQCVCTY
jgi:hypothetical protein